MLDGDIQKTFFILQKRLQVTKLSRNTTHQVKPASVGFFFIFSIYSVTLSLKILPLFVFKILKSPLYHYLSFLIYNPYPYQKYPLYQKPFCLLFCTFFYFLYFILLFSTFLIFTFLHLSFHFSLFYRIIYIIYFASTLFL